MLGRSVCGAVWETQDVILPNGQSLSRTGDDLSGLKYLKYLGWPPCEARDCLNPLVDVLKCVSSGFLLLFYLFFLRLLYTCVSCFFASDFSCLYSLAFAYYLCLGLCFFAEVFHSWFLRYPWCFLESCFLAAPAKLME